jgi:isocitrate lyase
MLDLERATYLLTKKMIEAGNCQIENQVSTPKQCRHQDGITVPHEDFLAKNYAIHMGVF